MKPFQIYSPPFQHLFLVKVKEIPLTSKKRRQAKSCFVDACVCVCVCVCVCLRVNHTDFIRLGIKVDQGLP